MIFEAKINGRSIKAPTEKWLASLWHVLSVDGEKVTPAARSVRALPGPNPRPITVEYEGETITEDAYAWVAQSLRRMTDQARKAAVDLVHKQMVSYQNAMPPDAVAIVLPDGGTAVASVEPWIAAILVSVPTDTRDKVFRAVQGHKRLFATPGSYVLHAEAGELGIRVH